MPNHLSDPFGERGETAVLHLEDAKVLPVAGG